MNALRTNSCIEISAQFTLDYVDKGSIYGYKEYI